MMRLGWLCMANSKMLRKLAIRKHSRCPPQISAKERSKTLTVASMSDRAALSTRESNQSRTIGVLADDSSCSIAGRPRGSPDLGCPWSATCRRPRLARLGLTHERVFLRVLDGFHGEVDIEVGPIQMMRTRQLHVGNRSNGRVPKPRKLLERDEQLLVVDDQPEPVC